jgi:two-component system LytT family response regulator
MHEPTSIEPDRPNPALRRHAFDALAIALVFIAYAVTLSASHELPIVSVLPAAFANTVPVIVFGGLARRLVADRIVGRRLLTQLLGNAAVGTWYALLAYWLTTVLLGFVHGQSATEFIVEPFIRRAMAWQLLENYTTYAVIAALAYLSKQSQAVTVILSSGNGENGQSDKGLSRYFIRSGEEFRPIDVERIISIAGADDYAEVTTLDGRHLVRMTLAEFERVLDPAKFVRVHRSRIVNLDRIERAEPAGGGRMLLHMADGEMVSTSRPGARLLRDLVI